MTHPQLPTADDLSDQYESGQIDHDTALRLSLHHLRLLYRYKEIDLLVLNGLLRDVQAIAEELKLHRPSAALRLRLLEWVKQAEDAADALARGAPGLEDKAD
jgi:hypothetical protein